MPRLLPTVRNTSDTPPPHASSSLLQTLAPLSRTKTARLSERESEWAPWVVGGAEEVIEVAEDEGVGRVLPEPRGWVSTCGNNG